MEQRVTDSYRTTPHVRPPGALRQLIAVRLALSPDAPGVNAELAGPELGQLSRVLVGVILKAIVDQVARHSLIQRSESRMTAGSELQIATVLRSRLYPSRHRGRRSPEMTDPRRAHGRSEPLGVRVLAQTSPLPGKQLNCPDADCFYARAPAGGARPRSRWWSGEAQALGDLVDAQATLDSELASLCLNVRRMRHGEHMFAMAPDALPPLTSQPRPGAATRPACRRCPGRS